MTTEREDFLQRVRQHQSDRREAQRQAEAQYEAGDEFFGGLATMMTLLFIAAILFGIPYLISLGWHAAMR